MSELRLAELVKGAFGSDGPHVWDALNQSLVSDDSSDRSVEPLLHRLRSGNDRRPISIAALGASVTFGHGIRHAGERAWPALLAEGVRRVWNHSAVRVLNAALPATRAGFAALCYDTLVRRRADVVLIEYSYTTHDEDGEILGMLVDTARLRGAVVLVVDWWPTWDIASCDRCWPSRLGGARNAADAQCGSRRLLGKASFIRRRDVRFLSVLRARHAPILSWLALRILFASSSDDVHRAAIASDCRHLSERGHEALAAVALHGLWQLDQRARRTPRADLARADAGHHAGHPGLPSGTRASCSIGERLLRHVRDGPRRTRGWGYVRQEGAFQDKPGLLTTAAGSSLDLRLLPPFSAVDAPCRRLVVVHLKSYQHMGIAALSCHGACTCEPRAIDAHNTERVSLETLAPPLTVCPAATADGAPSRRGKAHGGHVGGHVDGHSPAHPHCHVRVAVVNESRSGEHKFKITGLVSVEGEPTGGVGTALNDLQDFVDWSSRDSYHHALHLEASDVRAASRL
jgi:hypothetical protein